MALNKHNLIVRQAAAMNCVVSFIDALCAARIWFDRLRLNLAGCRHESLYPYVTTLDTGSVNSESRSTAIRCLLFNDAFLGDRYTVLLPVVARSDRSLHGSL
jgi:hypothetical protein